MTKQVRAGYRNHRRATWAAALAVFVAAALALVLPALGSTTSGCSTPNSLNCVKPATTTQLITPTTVNVGGSNFRCGSAGATYPGAPAPSGMRQFQISKPTPGDYTDPATGVTFHVSGPTGSQDPKSYFSFSVNGSAAVVYHVGVNGGTQTEWYDYFNNTPAHKAFPGGGVYGDTDLHSTPDSKYTTTNFSFFTASITTFCYVPLTVAPSCASPFSGIGFGGATYSAQLAPNNGACKTSNVVMYTYNDNGTLFATLHPATPTGANYRVVEHIHWTGSGFGPPLSDPQDPIELWYDDQPPYDGSLNKTTMQLCTEDPRANPITAPFTLPSSLNDSDVLPSGQTSCMLLHTVSAPAPGDASTTDWVYDAWIFSNVDGGRGVFAPA